MTRHKLLIVDNSEEFPMALAEILQGDYQVQYCLDGKEALSLLHSFQPDILLLELMIPSLDGISLIQAAAADGLHPVVMTFTRFYNEYMMAALTKLNVSYWMVKPCDVHATAQRIYDLNSRIGVHGVLIPDPQTYVRELLFSLGFIAKHHGYTYLLDAIVMELQTPDQSVTKHIYPAIAAKYNCPQVNVEHAIRTAIKSAWKKRNDDVWRQYFLPGPDGTIARPTNGAFISRLAQELRPMK